MTERFVTYDVWDTLLRRRCDSLAVKLFTCRALLLKNWDVLEPRWRDAWRLLWLRHKIEIGLVHAGRRKGLDGEYTLEDVLEALVRRCSREGTCQDDISRIAAELYRIEITQERFVTYPDPEIAGVIAAHGSARSAFLSDFHLSSPIVADLLRAHGLEQVARTGIVSCDVGLAKKSGRLYEHARQALGIGAATWLHVGDDEHADGRAASRLGITALLHRPPHETSLSRERERLIGRPDIPIAEAHRGIIESARQDDAMHRTARLRGVGLALLMCGFALWVLEESLKRRAAGIRYVGDGCELLAAVHRSVAEVYADALPMPHASTHAVDEPSSAEVAVAIGPDPQQSKVGSDGVQLSMTGSSSAASGASYLGAAMGSDSTDALRQRLDVLAGASLTGDEAATFRESLLAASGAFARAMRTHAVSSEDVLPFAQAVWRNARGGATTDWGETAMPSGARRGLRRALQPAVAVPMTIRAMRSLSRIKRRLRRSD